jgi:hypothetical protein
MKLTNIIKESKTIQRENKGPCWDGYQQIGMKMKGGTEVPNCVPKNEANEASKKIPLFIPNVGNIDDFKLKSLLQKNPKVKTILGDKEFKFLNQDNTDVIMVSGKPFNSITTDGELEFELDLKKNILVKPLGKARPKIVAHYSQNKAVSEATHTSAPGEWVGFVSKEKGKKLMGVFKSATGAKSWLTKNQNSLLNQSDVRSVGIQPKKDWDAREAKYAIESVNEMNVNKKFGSKYDIGAGSMGSGTTFWNRAQEVSGDYKTIAHVSDNGKVTFYDKKLPNDVKKHIEDYVKTKTEGMVENFIPSVGTIDKFKLKDLLLKNPKVKDILSDTEYKFLKSNNTDVIMHQSKRFNSITTDGKLEFEIDLKNNKLVKPLGKARKAIVDYYSKTKNESVNENSKNKGHWERVGNQTIVDSNFINLSKGVLPNSELVHLGGGDFALKTSDGEIVFSRTSKPTGIADDFVGRVHHMTDNKGGKLLNNLVQLMGKSKKAVLSMSEAVGITEAGCGCGSVKTSNPYSLSEFVIKESRNIQKIQKDYNDTVLKLKSTLEKYKEAKGTPNEKKWVDELKKLTVLKKKYQSELDKGVQSLYKDAEYEGE